MLPASGEVHEIRDEVEFDNKVKNKDSNFHKVRVSAFQQWSRVADDVGGCLL